LAGDGLPAGYANVDANEHASELLSEALDDANRFRSRLYQNRQLS
jgi:hypothetical protein